MRRRIALRGLLLGLAAALVGTALGAAPASAATDAIQGRIDDHGRAVSGVQVGYFAPRTKVKVWVRTGSDGRFRLEAPSTAAAGYLWAGRFPGREDAAFTLHGVDYVRAIVGAGAPGSVPSALYQTQRAASPARIGGGGPLSIHLRRAGRVAGADRTLRRAKVVLRRGDGSLVLSTLTDASGGYRSTPLVPGRYRLSVRPRGSSVASDVGTIRVRSGRTARLPRDTAATIAARQSVVEGTISAPSSVASVAARIEVRAGARLVAAVRARQDGGYRIRGLAAGRYTLVAGRNTPDEDDDAPRVHPTPDDTVAVSRSVVARAAHTTHADIRLEAAGQVSGSAPANALIVVEDSSGAVVRVARATTTGRFTAGGLPAGSFAVLATDYTSFGSVTATVATGRVTDVGAIAASAPLPTVHGTVAPFSVSTGEGVVVGADLVGVAGAYDTVTAIAGAGYRVETDGSFTLTTLLPGLHHLIVQTYRTVGAPHRLQLHEDSAPVDVRIVDGSTPLHLAAGPLRGHLGGDIRTSVGIGAGWLPTEVDRADGTAIGVSGNWLRGEFEIDAAPGTYTWERSRDVVVATDGPWWGEPVQPAITVPPGWNADAVVRITIRH